MPSYCFCKKGLAGDGRGFMILCESCEVWYHGRCVKVKEAPPESESWYCQECLQSTKQCANPVCTNGAKREKSKYCSDECGHQVNMKRYDKFFKPRLEQITSSNKNHSVGQVLRLEELSKLEIEKKDVTELIGRLKQEKEALEDDIKQIKTEAKRLREESGSFKDQVEDDVDMDSEDQEETTTSEQSKVFCIICGVPQPSEKAFKHWASCHRKQESNFNFSSDVQIKLKCPNVDEEPNLFCQRQDKKTKRYCMHIESACPQHSNWHYDKDEVCGCPLNISQELVADGNYCLELKKDCRLHYNWDRFRLASKNMDRIQAFSRLDLLNEKIIRTQQSIDDTHGGVYGFMRTMTIDHDDGRSNDEKIDVDVED